MSEFTPGTPAGWYPDPQVPGQQRYWDGSAWGDVAPGLSPAAAPQTSTNAVVGLVLAIVSWVICPLIAAIAALVLARSSSREIAASGGAIGGAGLNTATRIIAWLNIAVSIVAGIVLIILAVLGAGLFSQAAADLDPVTNTKTGLADGSYSMDPERTFSINDACTFGGPVFDSQQVRVTDTTIYGEGARECGDMTDVTTVTFEVTDGVARILTVE
jgi:hypothetical protein